MTPADDAEASRLGRFWKIGRLALHSGRAHLHCRPHRPDERLPPRRPPLGTLAGLGAPHAVDGEPAPIRLRSLVARVKKADVAEEAGERGKIGEAALAERTRTFTGIGRWRPALGLLRERRRREQ